jgi:hypothetical protein
MIRDARRGGMRKLEIRLWPSGVPTIAILTRWRIGVPVATRFIKVADTYGGAALRLRALLSIC